eukprot:COSAG05_NODE_2167_length_3442_cov_25.387377_3_plen_239_part_00
MHGYQVSNVLGERERGRRSRRPRGSSARGSGLNPAPLSPRSPRPASLPSLAALGSLAPRSSRPRGGMSRSSPRPRSSRPPHGRRSSIRSRSASRSLPRKRSEGWGSRPARKLSRPAEEPRGRSLAGGSSSVANFSLSSFSAGLFAEPGVTLPPPRRGFAGWKGRLLVYLDAAVSVGFSCSGASPSSSSSPKTPATRLRFFPRSKGLIAGPDPPVISSSSSKGSYSLCRQGSSEQVGRC